MNIFPQLSVAEIITAQDQRTSFRERLAKKYQLPIVVFKLNIPGSQKISPNFEKIFQQGIQQLQTKLNPYIQYQKQFKEKTGYTAFFSIKELIPIQIKTITIQIEENHKFGRIFDFDVYPTQNSQIKRKDLNLPQRKCFICNNNAFACARSQAHPINILLEKINSLINIDNK